MEYGLKVLVRDQWCYGALDIYVLSFRPDCKYLLHDKLPWNEWEKLEEGVEPSAPTARIPNDAVPLLLQALSDMGLRTDRDAKLEGTLEATRYHLEDVRAIAGLVAPPSRVVCQGESKE